MKESVIFVPTLLEAGEIFAGTEFVKNRFDLLEGDFLGIKVIISGISKTNITYAATVMFQNFSFKSAWLIGIAGCYKMSSLTVGEVVSVKNDYFVDEGLLIEGGLKMTSEIGFPVCNENKVQFNTIDKLKVVDANTVSFLSSFDELAEIYFSKTSADIENMEGAAFGLICNRFKVPAYHIRGVSNYCGDRKCQKWDFKKAVFKLKMLVNEKYFFRAE